MSGARKSAADADTLLSVDELAELGHVSNTMVRRLVCSGALPALKVGRLLRVRLSDWQTLLSGAGQARASAQMRAYWEAQKKKREHRMQTGPQRVSKREPRSLGL